MFVGIVLAVQKLKGISVNDHGPSTPAEAAILRGEKPRPFRLVRSVNLWRNRFFLGPNTGWSELEAFLCLLQDKFADCQPLGRATKIRRLDVVFRCSGVLPCLDQSNMCEAHGCQLGENTDGFALITSGWKRS